MVARKDDEMVNLTAEMLDWQRLMDFDLAAYLGLMTKMEKWMGNCLRLVEKTD